MGSKHIHNILLGLLGFERQFRSLAKVILISLLATTFKSTLGISNLRN